MMRTSATRTTRTRTVTGMIESSVKKEEHGECVENIKELLKLLLVEGGEE